ncbi:MAG: hypothetical protein EBR62_07235, partial [Verrucomicrobia bacterium]|nr:hypothetical protein [Verrucomicrobiota bacterium]
GAASTDATGSLGANTGTLQVNAGFLDLNGYSLTKVSASGNAVGEVINNAVGTTSTFTLGDATNFTFAPNIHDAAGAIAFAKAGTGVLTLSGNSTFSGGVTVNAGTLKLGSATALGNNTLVTVASGAAFDVNGQTLGDTSNGARSLSLIVTGTGDTLNNGATSGAITNSSATANYASAGILNVTLAGNASFGSNNGRFDIGRSEGSGLYGTISSTTGNSFTFTKVGSNQVTVRGTSTNVYFNIAAGLVDLEDFDSAGGLGVTVQSGAQVGSYGNRNILAPVSLLNGSTIKSLGGGTQTWSGAFTLGLTTGDVVSADSTSNTFGILGVISGAGKLNLTGTAAANFVRLAGNNTFTGGVDITTAGGLSLESPNALGAGNLTQTSTGAIDNLSGTAVTLTTTANYTLNNDLTFGGTAPLNLGTGLTTVLTADRTFTLKGSSLTFSGPVTGGFKITKTGAGLLVLSGNNTYSGGTALSAASYTDGGMIQVTSNTGLGTGAVTSSFNTGAWSSQVQLSGGITVANNFSMTGHGRDSTAAIQNYGNIASISGNNTVNGVVTVTSGGGASTVSASQGATLNLLGGITTSAGPRSLSLVGAGTINVGGTGAYDTTGAFQIGIGVLGVSNATNNIRMADAITGGGASGQATINQTNTSGMAVGQAVFRVNGGTYLGTIQTLNQNASLVLNQNLAVTLTSGTDVLASYGFTVGSPVITTQTSNITVGATVTGPGIPAGTTVVAISPNRSITLSNAVMAGGITGLLTVTAPVVPTANVNFTTTNNTYTGITTMMGGATVNVAGLNDVNTASSLGRGSSAPNAADILIDGATLQYTGATSTSTNRLFTLGVAGATLDASGTVSTATLNFTGSPTLAPISITTTGGVSGTNTITTGNTSGLVVGQAVSGTGIPAGATITAVNANASITISTALTATVGGTVTATNPTAIATGNAVNQFSGNRTLTLTGSNVGTNTFAPVITDVNNGYTGTVSLVKSGAGQWILSGANTFTGTTSVLAGVLDIAPTGSLAAGSAVGITGGTLQLEAGAIVA